MSAPRLLLVTPRFFGYEDDIAAEFGRQGFDVELVDERPSNRAVVKALLRVRPALAARVIRRHFERVAARGLAGFDLVLVIKGEVVPAWFLQRLRQQSPDAVLAFYTFDSAGNAAGFTRLLDQFDHLFSFERDAARIDPRFRLKHLFYAPDFAPLGSSAPRRFEAGFIGTLHSGRYRFAKRLLQRLERGYAHFFVQARWFFELQRLRDPRMREVDRADVRLDKLSRQQVAEVFRHCLAVLDMQHEKQSGLTMRSFEVIASGAYLVTTNAAIEHTELAGTGRVIVAPAEPSPEQADELAARIRALSPPEAAPPGFERFSLAAWVAEFAALVPRERP